MAGALLAYTDATQALVALGHRVACSKRALSIATELGNISITSAFAPVIAHLAVSEHVEGLAAPEVEKGALASELGVEDDLEALGLFMCRDGPTLSPKFHVVDACPVSSTEETFGYNDDGALVLTLEPGCFYKKYRLEEVNSYLPLTALEGAIRKSGINFHIEGDYLYLTNAPNVALGAPPTLEQLGVDVLEVKHGLPGCPSAHSESGSCEELFSIFEMAPSGTMFDLLRTDADIRRDFLKLREEVKIGGQELDRIYSRLACLGSVSIGGLVSAVQDIEPDAHRRFIIFMELRGLITLENSVCVFC